MGHLNAKVSLPSLPVAPTDRALFNRHYDGLVSYTDALRDGRCRKTTRFTKDLSATMAAFGPLFLAWNTEILFALYMNGALRFNAIKAKLSPVSSRVLTDKLRGLMNQGLVLRSDSKPMLYELTPRGEVVARHLHPLLFFLQTT